MTTVTMKDRRAYRAALINKGVPEVYAEMAAQELNEEGLYWRYTYTAAELLDAGFYWGHSELGHDFWQAVFKCAGDLK